MYIINYKILMKLNNKSHQYWRKVLERKGAHMYISTKDAQPKIENKSSVLSEETKNKKEINLLIFVFFLIQRGKTGEGEILTYMLLVLG
jgi:hypothetical protein